MTDDDVRESPPAVVGAVSVGTAPLPFLAVYAVLFILHGWFAPAHPPDITSSQTGELIAGIVAAVVFIVLTVTLWWLLNGHRRWPFALVQPALLAGAIYLLTDVAIGGRAVLILIAATTTVALALAFAPGGWSHVGRATPALIARLYRRPTGTHSGGRGGRAAR